MAPFRGHALALLLLASSAPAVAQSECAGITIDTFAHDHAQLTLLTPAPGAAASLSTSDASILGGERELYIEMSGSTVNGASAVNVASSRLLYGATVGVAGLFRLVYDGDDDALGAPGFASLAADLLAGGGGAFELVADAGIPARLRMTVYSGATAFSELTDADAGAGAPGIALTPAGPAVAYRIPFSFFAIGAGAAAPADFADVHAIEIHVDTVAQLDVSFERFCVESDLIMADGFE